MKLLHIALLLLLIPFGRDSLAQHKDVYDLYISEISSSIKRVNGVLGSDRHLDPIRGKILFSTPGRSLEQLGNAARPSKKEQKAIDAYDALMIGFWKENSDISSRYGIQTSQEANNRFRARLAMLRSGQWTYGEYLAHLKEDTDRELANAVIDQKRREAEAGSARRTALAEENATALRNAEHQRRLQAEIDKLDDEIARTKQDIARSQRDSAVMGLGLQLLQQGQPRYLGPPPSTPINCRSQPMGGYVNTICY